MRKCINCKKGDIKRNAFKFCSHKCEQEFKMKKLIASGNADPRTIKKYLIKKLGHQCKLCKLTKWMGKPIPLVLDHIDGNSEDCRLFKVRLICCNCDAQTPTYKGKNKGKGRHYRRMRYKQGKSY